MAKSIPEHKIASTEYDIHNLIKKRRSPRAFADKPVEHDLLRQLFDAARWAPSSYNEQPWRFIVATKNQPEEYEKLAQVLNDYNSEWATSAPVLILTLAKNHFEKNNNANKHAQHDVGQAISYLTFEATRHDLFVHQMAGILPEKAIELYNIPEHYTPMTMVAVGYYGDMAAIPEKFHKGEKAQRSRLSIDDIVFRGEWDKPKPL